MTQSERLARIRRLAGSGCCDLKEKVSPLPPDPKRELCELDAWLDALIGELGCKAIVNPVERAKCCEKIESDYCDTWDACQKG